MPIEDPTHYRTYSVAITTVDATADRLVDTVSYKRRFKFRNLSATVGITLGPSTATYASGWSLSPGEESPWFTTQSEMYGIADTGLSANIASYVEKLV